MFSQPVKQTGICWPEELVFSHDDDLVGFLMPLAKEKSLQESLFVGRCKEHFPGWDRSHLCEISLGILNKLNYLHDLSILMGDINPSNILIVGDCNVYFVDTNSYQFGYFPCPVGHPTYTPPELQGEKFREFLRTPENEYFTVAILLFMIFLLGQKPYSHKGGANPAHNIRKGYFPYPLDGDSGNDIPPGPWASL
jgi:DNA-binding helix-hairpin-helix protein with protein kinase domain